MKSNNTDSFPEEVPHPESMSAEELSLYSTDICDEDLTIEGLLPTVNGGNEVGISVNSDGALNGGSVLRIILAKTRQAQAILSAAATLKALRAFAPAGSKAEEIIMACAFAIVFYDVVGEIRRPGARTWVKSGEYEVVKRDYVSKQDIDHVRAKMGANSSWAGKALCTVCSMKLSWWMTNHHTGQGRVTTYFRKMVISNYGEEVFNNKEALDAFYMAGHWAGTHIVLYHLELYTGVEMRTFGR